MRTATELNAESPIHCSILGVALFRASDAEASVQTLEKATQMSTGGDQRKSFFLAMAYWQLGEQDKARLAYSQAVEWTDKNQPGDQTVRRFRAEAAQLTTWVLKPTSSPVAATGSSPSGVRFEDQTNGRQRTARNGRSLEVGSWDSAKPADVVRDQVKGSIKHRSGRR